MTKKIDMDLVLSYPMQDNDAGAINIADYLHTLLWELWRQGEEFSGKRPFGNSGWECDLYKPLIQGGFVKGELDEDGYVNDVDTKAANKIIFDCIDHVFSKWAEV